MPRTPEKRELLQGTLDLLILKTLDGGAKHGFAIARRIQQASQGHLQVEEGSLYPALHRMQRRGWLEAEWGPSETNRKAKYYHLTTSGRAELASQQREWERLATAIGRVLAMAPVEG